MSDLIDLQSSKQDGVLTDLLEKADVLDAQDWMKERFEGLTPEDFGNVRFLCTMEVDPPDGFASCWHSFTSSTASRLAMQLEAFDLDAILIVSNPFHESEREAVKQLIDAAGDLCSFSAAIFLRHSCPLMVSEDICARGLGMHQYELNALILDHGIDGAVVDEPIGFNFSLKVRSQILRAMKAATRLVDAQHEIQERPIRAQRLRRGIDDMIWGHFRSHLAPNLPALDKTIAAEPAQVGKFTIGPLLGKGAFGEVFMLATMPGAPKQAIKKMIKSKVATSVDDLRSMNRTVAIMTELRKKGHANIVQCFEVYQSRTHVFFRMEFAGSQNLHKCIMNNVLGSDETLSALQQILAAVAHLHENYICHRDLKPENMMVAYDDTLQLKVADFDTATWSRDGELCSTAWGTHPFAAMDMFTRKGYDGKACDVWSLGVVLLELQCGSGVLERFLKLPPSMRLAEKVFENFKPSGQAARFMEARSKSSLACLLPLTSDLVSHMLLVDSKQRWPANALADCATAWAWERKRRPRRAAA